jgi:hypothetical protein
MMHCACRTPLPSQPTLDLRVPRAQRLGTKVPWTESLRCSRSVIFNQVADRSTLLYWFIYAILVGKGGSSRIISSSPVTGHLALLDDPLEVSLAMSRVGPLLRSQLARDLGRTFRTQNQTVAQAVSASPRANNPSASVIGQKAAETIQ